MPGTSGGGFGAYKENGCFAAAGEKIPRDTAEIVERCGQAGLRAAPTPRSAGTTRTYFQNCPYINISKGICGLEKRILKSINKLD